jgi:predicted O-methyltransferase YrrM
MIILPTSRVILKSKDINKRKLFNYYIQNLETYENIKKLKKIVDLIETLDYKSRVVLITYDAILLDFSAEDGKDFLIKLKNILQEGGMVVKHKYGLDYNFS